MYGQGRIWLPSIATIAAAIWFVLGNSIKKNKNKETPSSPTPMVNNTTASSTSASAADFVGEYEVFLSFRGIDTRKSFTDFLYHDLVDAGVRTFKDDNELRVGEEIGPDLLRAIKQSKISIPIFSKNYASSKWCLREFAQMLDCRANGKQKIYPIFYDVEPNEVQHCESGSYKDAFLKHKKDEKLNEEIVQQWMKALETIGDLKGWELKKETNGCEGKLVKVVVENILLELKKNFTHVPENLVGMDNRIEELKRLLNVNSNGVRIVGIYGMGGLGKTTIAKVIYNQLCERFERCCFLEDVQDKSKQDKDIVNLQNQLLSKIQRREVPKFDDFDGGTNKIKDMVREKKVLLVLDNVDRDFQIKKLVGDHKCFGDQSLIIITTRNKDVLDTIEMTCQTEGRLEVYKSYELQLLNDKDSLQLFCKHAFRKDSPPKDYDVLARKFVSIAANLPLVLVTLGSSLFIEKDIDVWDEKLRKLEKVPDGDVMKQLRISYEALEHEQKQIFLDIALLFNRCNKREPCYMWNSCEFYPTTGINTLVRRSLLTIGDNDTLIMHDSLRDLGKQIIREEDLSVIGKRSRLRDKEALQVLEADEGTEHVQVLHLGDDEKIDYTKPVPVRCFVRQDFCKLPNLRFLSMHTVDLDGNFQNLLQNLRWLRWHYCPGNFAPTNFNLKNLVVLDLSWSKITNDWGGWSQIKKSEKLKVLILNGCRHLSRVPHLYAFPSLEVLQLGNCENLCNVDGLEQLKSLKYLNVYRCLVLERLPDLSKLTKLQTLIVDFCCKLTTIQGLDRLASLEQLYIGGCVSLKELLDLSNLRKLKHLNLSTNIDIQGLDRLESLQRLAVSSDKSKRILPDLPNFGMLKRIWLDEWEELQDVETLGVVAGSLESLEMSSCKALKNMLDLTMFKKLKKLSITSMEGLTELQGLEELKSLEFLDISVCTSIENLPDFSSLTNLKELEASYCVKLTEIRGLEKLGFLKSLTILGCKSLKNLPYLPNTTIYGQEFEEEEYSSEYQSSDGSDMS